jgi:hypothetical protein
MQAIGLRGDDSWTSFGGHRGTAGPARFGLDLTRAKADSEGAAGPGSYPSPPMSGSPPLPPKPSNEVAEPSSGTAYRTTAQGVYSGIPATQSEERTQTAVAGGPRPFLPQVTERALYPFPPRLEGSATRPLHYPQQLGQAVAQPAAYLQPGPGTRPAPGHPGPLPAPQPYPATTHHHISDPLQHAPPKSQRKTKGHVASACVPCKKAHLRSVTRHKSPLEYSNMQNY